jgi:hypothetical protein
MEQIRLPRKNRHKAVSPEVYWDLTAQKSVQAAETKCGTAVEKNEEWAIRSAALTIATTSLKSCYGLENTLTKRIVLIAGNHVTGSRHIDIFRSVRGEAAVWVCIHSFVRHTAWVVVRISRSGVQHCNSRRTTTADTFRR